MAKQGLTGITMVGDISNESVSQLRLRRVVNNDWSGWTSNKMIDVQDNNSQSVMWKKLQNKELTHEEVIDILRGKEDIKFRLIDVFESNKTIINVSKLYNSNMKHYCVFLCDRASWRLLIVRCKTAQEILQVGYDSQKRSYAPLIIGIGDGKRNIVNSI